MRLSPAPSPSSTSSRPKAPTGLRERGRALLVRLARSLVAFGGRLGGRRPPPAAALPQAVAIHPFDVVHGVDTSGLLRSDELLSGRRNDIWSTAYYAIAPSIFTASLTRLEPAIHARWARFSFVDLGSGKGRALMLAARLPFARVIGVELHPELHRIAEANLRHLATDPLTAPEIRCGALRVLNQDATLAPYPATPLVVFLYHPFHAPVLRRALFHLRRSLRREPREAWILYINAEAEHVFNDFPEFHREWEETFAMAPEDLLADRTGSSDERVVAFHYTPRPPAPALESDVRSSRISGPQPT